MPVFWRAKPIAFRYPRRSRRRNGRHCRRLSLDDGAGALRGISLIELANLNVSALQILLPRITEPTLTAHDVANMDPADLLAVGAEVAGFLASKADRLSVSPAK
ncbi:phage tail assembly protein [Janthinobacterium sp. GW456P]|uniref:phage tail assembly protein n=1 Tax=Janthinobacterium sp. GW456P TaxID=1981506 RepID=UPI001122C9AF